jgi:hypothetical protein
MMRKRLKPNRWAKKVSKEGKKANPDFTPSAHFEYRNGVWVPVHRKGSPFKIN